MLSFLSGKSKKVKEDLQFVVNSLVNCRMETAKMQSTQEHSKTALLLSFGAKYTMGISPCVHVLSMSLIIESYAALLKLKKEDRMSSHVNMSRNQPD